MFLKKIKWPALLSATLFSALSFSAPPMPTRVMPLGDSITGSPGCWRAYLWQKLENAGYANGLDFVGSLGPQGCAVAHDGDNEGHGGILATNMANQDQLVPWLAQTDPQIVLMHLGTNDVWSRRPTGVILDAFTKLIGDMRQHNPATVILVAQIIPMDPDGSCDTCDTGVINLNSAIPQWAAQLSTARSPIIVVDQWTGFDAVADTYDGVHPNAAGDQKMAAVWFDALSKVLDGEQITSSSSSAVSSVVSSASSSEQSVSSSSSSSFSYSSAPNEGYCVQMCKWYQDGPRPLCEHQDSGWGYENQLSCIGINTCNQQQGNGGVVEFCLGTESSSSAINSSSSTQTSSSSSIQSSSSISSSSSSIQSSSQASSVSSEIDEVTCEVTRANVWNSGYQLDVTISNEGGSQVSGWNVRLDFDHSPTITGSWNVELDVSGTSITASGVGWNSAIGGGQSVGFGFQGSYSGSFTAPVCMVLN